MSFKNVSPFASVFAAAPSHCVVDQTDVADEIEAAKRALEDDIAFDDDFEATEAPRDDADIDEQSPALNASISFSSHASLTRNRDAIAGFDETKGDTWIYPTNLPLRDYQFNIAQKALYNNTLVCLPTGLGKTFIAAVLMYNFYRWYPGGRIVFMAPTKPLVAQQIEACFKVMGIPQSDMSEMTGHMAPPKRELEWREKRVFFLTPQVIQNDLSRGSCPADSIVCLVVDEAHRALGNHAYSQVVRELSKVTTDFRVLALSATPGDNGTAVQEVITNLMISHVEIRSEQAIDIRPYVHKRKEEKFVIPIGEELSRIKRKYLDIIAVPVTRLCTNGALYNRNPDSLCKFGVFKAREGFRKRLGTEPPNSILAWHRGIVEGDFALAITLYHGLELLLQHGLRSFYHFMKSSVDGTKGATKARFELLGNASFQAIMHELRDKFDPCDDVKMSPSKFMTSSEKKPKGRVSADVLASSHPKLKKLLEIVLEHFKSKGNSTRVMVFSQYRESVHEIVEVLSQHAPIVKPMSFIGQASTGKSNRGLTQKEQIEVVRSFREGGYNTLVATCVGEEGLDIGEVDLIVCFDAHASPIRLVQRIGRTGRKRDGRIVVLVTEGKEEKISKRSERNKKDIYKYISDASRWLQLYSRNPRMVPRHFRPVVRKVEMNVADFVNLHATRRKRKALPPIENDSDGFPSVATAKRKPKSPFLTSDELVSWSKNYMVSAKEASTIAKTVEGALKRDRPLVCLTKKGDDAAGFSGSAYAEDQATYSPVFRVSHSRTSEQLVEMMQFAEECRSWEENGYDPYAMEMAAYLNIDDVVIATTTTTTKKTAKGNRLLDSDDDVVERKTTEGILSDSEEEIVAGVAPGDVKETGSVSIPAPPSVDEALAWLHSQKPEISDVSRRVIAETDDEEDDTPVVVGKKKRNVFLSPESEISLVKVSKRKRLVASSDDDDDDSFEDIAKRPKKRKTKERLFIDTDDDDDIFEDRGRAKSTKKSVKINEFIEDEAQLSDCDAIVVSSDENEDETAVDDSFINDETLPSQEREKDGPSPASMTTVYRKSLLSPSCRLATMGNAYKMRFSPRHQLYGKQDGVDLRYTAGNDLDSSFIDDRSSFGEAEEDNRFEISEENESEQGTTPRRPATARRRVLRPLDTSSELDVSSKSTQPQNDDAATAFGFDDDFDDDLDAHLQRLSEEELTGADVVVRASTPKVPEVKTKSPALVEKKARNAVLVDSKTASTSSVIVSALRLTHGVDLRVCSISHCDFIVSNRMGVKKVFRSDFAKGGKATRLIDQIKAMFEFFDRPCLIIERDREKAKTVGRNKNGHMNSNLACFVQTNMKILFSDSPEMTASLLNDLAGVEKAKKAGFHLPEDLNQDTCKPAFKFLLSIPQISFITAADLYYSFSSLDEIIRSTSDELVKRAHNLSKNRADSIIKYFTYTFDSSMLHGRLCII